MTSAAGVAMTSAKTITYNAEQSFNPVVDAETGNVAFQGNLGIVGGSLTFVQLKWLIVYTVTSAMMRRQFLTVPAKLCLLQSLVISWSLMQSS